MLQKSLAYVSQEKCYAATEVLDSKIRLEVLTRYVHISKIHHAWWILEICTYLVSTSNLILESKTSVAA